MHGGEIYAPGSLGCPEACSHRWQEACKITCTRGHFVIADTSLGENECPQQCCFFGLPSVPAYFILPEVALKYLCRICRCAAEVEAGQLAEDDTELSAALRCLTAWQDDHTAVDRLLERLRVEDREGCCAEDAEAATQARPPFLSSWDCVGESGNGVMILRMWRGSRERGLGNAAVLACNHTEEVPASVITSESVKIFGWVRTADPSHLDWGRFEMNMRTAESSTGFAVQVSRAVDHILRDTWMRYVVVSEQTCLVKSLEAAADAHCKLLTGNHLPPASVPSRTKLLASTSLPMLSKMGYCLPEDSCHHEE